MSCKLGTVDVEFLERHGYTCDNVRVCTGIPRKKWRSAIEGRPEILFVVTKACTRHGHLLRFRSGHCAPCNPKMLTYQLRHRRAGDVYIACSRTLALTKIGSAINAGRRILDLNKRRYGGVADWQLYYFKSFSESGAAESELKRKFKDCIVSRPYLHDGKPQMTQEMFDIRPDIAEMCLDIIYDSLHY